jgi:hypothetical protein
MALALLAPVASDPESAAIHNSLRGLADAPASEQEQGIARHVV